ncbi:hypothetical protein [Thalassotalea mangrovi]|uniref:Tetratricopeptide repeat protein n=1 Tax=Thalassotalea mangrovi TaxID=2572245 RepID=A0A4U1BA63_9GAMM|nr:hypothetical protein [Thalassotalea mangrovi]TKB47699.1 hypothetical protein E8M12_00700 [Thalassotalea mangrovi]
MTWVSCLLLQWMVMGVATSAQAITIVDEQPANKEMKNPIALPDQVVDELNQWITSWWQKIDRGVGAFEEFNKEFAEKIPTIESIRTRRIADFITHIGELDEFINRNDILLDTNNQTEWIYFKAHRATFLNDIERAKQLHQLLVNHHDPKTRLRAHSNLLNLGVLSENYDLMLEHHQIIVESLPDIADFPLKDLLLLTLGYFYNHIGEFNQAQQTFAQVNAAGLPPRRQCVIALHMLETTIGLQRTTEVFENLQRTEHLCLKSHEPAILNAALIETAHYFLNQHAPEKISDFIKKYQRIIETNTFQRMNNQHMLLHYYWQAGEDELASRYAQQLTAELESLEQMQHFNRWVTASYKLLADYHYATNALDLAQAFLDHYQRHLQRSLQDEQSKAQSREFVRLAKQNAEQQRVKLKQRLLANNVKQQRNFTQLQHELQHQLVLQYSLLSLAVITLMLYVYLRRYQHILSPLKRQLSLDVTSSALNRTAFEKEAVTALNSWRQQSAGVGALIIRLPDTCNNKHDDLSSIDRKLVCETGNPEEVSEVQYQIEVNQRQQIRLTVNLTRQLAQQALQIRQPACYPPRNSWLQRTAAWYQTRLRGQKWLRDGRFFLLARTSHQQLILLLGDMDKKHTLTFATKLQQTISKQLGHQGAIGVTHSDNSGYRFRYLMMDLTGALRLAQQQGKHNIARQDDNSAQAMPAYCPQTVIESPNYRTTPVFDELHDMPFSHGANDRLTPGHQPLEAEDATRG